VDTRTDRYQDAVLLGIAQFRCFGLARAIFAKGSLAVDVTIEVVGSGTADEVRSLREWLVAEDALRGRIRLVASPPEPGALGSAVEILTVALGPSGVATALASVVISWLRRRTGAVSVKVTRPDGTSFEYSAAQLGASEAMEVLQRTSELARGLSTGEGEVPGGPK
jgi:hypothetical protein